MKFLRRRSGLQTKNRIKSCEKVYSLQYAQVVKRREGGRIVQVNTRVVFGTPEAVAARLAYSPVSSTVNTSFVEVRSVGRKEALASG
jgi:hypothetical protein